MGTARRTSILTFYVFLLSLLILFACTLYFYSNHIECMLGADELQGYWRDRNIYLLLLLRRNEDNPSVRTQHSKFANMFRSLGML